MLYIFEAQSICLPLSTTTLLVNAILSILILNEPWNAFDVIAIIIIISGTVVTVRFGPIGATPIKTMDELKSRFRDKSFLITLGWFTLVSLAAYLYCKFILILNVLNIKRVNKEYGKDKGTAKADTDSINAESVPKLKRSQVITFIFGIYLGSEHAFLYFLCLIYYSGR